MKISKERLKEIIKDVLREETEYQKFFAKALKNLVSLFLKCLMKKRKHFLAKSILLGRAKAKKKVKK